MIGICNADMRMNLCYQLLKQHKDCILIDDGNYVPIYLDMLILPMSGLREDHTMTFKGVNMKLSDNFFDMVKEDGIIVTAQVTDSLRKLGKKIVDLNDYDQLYILFIYFLSIINIIILFSFYYYFKNLFLF